MDELETYIAYEPMTKWSFTHYVAHLFHSMHLQTNSWNNV